jgi:hypothetical protein
MVSYQDIAPTTTLSSSDAPRNGPELMVTHYMLLPSMQQTLSRPRTNQLWLKLFRLGMGGVIFDWLRMVYK